MSTIKFYGQFSEYGFLSNFYPCAFKYLGKEWESSEHAYQAQKFLDEDIQEIIRKAFTAGDAKRYGSNRTNPLRPNWEAIKDGVMLSILRCKFKQNPKLSNLLLSTNDNFLVEHTKKDAYWGDGEDGSGLNMLGHLLMAVRYELKTIS